VQLSTNILIYLQLCAIIFNYLQLRFCFCDLGHIAPLFISAFWLFLTHQPSDVRLKDARGLVGPRLVYKDDGHPLLCSSDGLPGV
jgi:hypothetical protein